MPEGICRGKVPSDVLQQELLAEPTGKRRKPDTSVVVAGCLATMAHGQIVPSADVEKHIQHVEAGLLPSMVIVKGGGSASAPQAHTLHERMAALHVPAVSLAVVHHGQIEWARGDRTWVDVELFGWRVHDYAADVGGCDEGAIPEVTP